MLDLKELEKACAEATPGPWAAAESNNNYTCVYADNEVTNTNVAILVWSRDAEFIANARGWVPALVAEVKRLKLALEFAVTRINGEPGSAATDEPEDFLEKADAAIRARKP